jgi:hypothetical protein
MSSEEQEETEHEDSRARTISLDDLIENRDRMLTSGQVAELLNVNVNTLYLWRTAPGDVNLPYCRFVAPGQTRGMIRYLYSDVVEFLENARAIGEAEIEAAQLEQAEKTPRKKRSLDKVTHATGEISEEELIRREKNQKRRAQKKSKAKRDALLEKPLVNLLQEQHAERRTELEKLTNKIEAKGVDNQNAAAIAQASLAREKILKALENMGQQ